MTEPVVTTVVDQDGRLHWAAADSKFVRDGLDDGSLRHPEEVQGAPEDAATGDDLDTAGAVDGPEHGAGDDTRPARGGKRARAAQPETGG